MGYAAVNFPVDICCDCGLNGVIYEDACPKCGGTIVKEAYLGGAVYYCPVCQKL
jgi:formamidopyrimidine-DNA glycosylase